MRGPPGSAHSNALHLLVTIAGYDACDQHTGATAWGVGLRAASRSAAGHSGRERCTPAGQVVSCTAVRSPRRASVCGQHQYRQQQQQQQQHQQQQQQRSRSRMQSHHVWDGEGEASREDLEAAGENNRRGGAWSCQPGESGGGDEEEVRESRQSRAGTHTQAFLFLVFLCTFEFTPHKGFERFQNWLYPVLSTPFLRRSLAPLPVLPSVLSQC